MYADRVDSLIVPEVGPNLHGRVRNAIEFARSAVSLLLEDNLPIDLKTYEASPDKLVAETALLADAVLMLDGLADGDLAASADLLVQGILPHARSRHIAIACLAHPGLFKDYLAAHLVLGRCGYPDKDFQRVLNVSAASELVSCRERLPHRRLEQEWLAYLGGATYAPEELAGDTALAFAQDVLFSSRDDVYAFTHALMYLTDFGRLPLPSSMLAEDLCDIAGASLVAAMDCDDFDLAGELLLTWPLTGTPFDARATFCFQVLCEIEDEVGILPSFSLDGREFRDLEVNAREHYKAAAGYHTVYVMGLLCALLIRSGFVPVFSRLSAPKGQAGTEIPSRAKQPEWVRVYARLETQNRSALQSFCSDADLVRAARKLNLEALRHHLQIANITGPSTLIQLQCARLLKRLSAEELAVVLNR